MATSHSGLHSDCISVPSASMGSRKGELTSFRVFPLFFPIIPTIFTRYRFIERMKRLTNRQTDGHTDRRTNGQTDKQTLS